MLTEVSLSNLGDDLGDIEFTATNGNWFDGVNLWLGQNDDRLSVTSIPSAVGSLQTTTSVHCGGGDDNVTVSLDESALEDVVFIANGQDGDDTIDASQSTLRVILFGDGGDDTLKGGSNDDIVIGDYGRVAWRSSDVFNIFNPDAEIEAIAGGGGYGDFTDGVVRLVTDAHSLATHLGGVDNIDGNGGNDVIIGGASGDNITGGDGSDIIVSFFVRQEG